MYYFSNKPTLTESEALDFYTALVSKYNNNDSPHLDCPSDSETLYGDDTLGWLTEFFREFPNEVYVLENSKTILQFATGREVTHYISERDWTGYEYFITNPARDFLWRIWHEETIDACGMALDWLRQRKMKFFELLRSTQENVLLSAIQVAAWGRAIELSGVIQSTPSRDQQFTMMFLNCNNIDWRQHGSEPSQGKLRVKQVYFGMQYRGLFEEPFFSLRADRFSMSFTYEQVTVSTD
ncbi:MAG: hypothetical protein KF716_13615 [Anaerolineae bacterium]|nr:hypothetical protein [Anaerolineae bacterium]